MRKALPILALLSSLAVPVAAHAELRGRLVRDDKPAASLTVSAIPYESPFEEARRQARGGEAPKAFAQVTSGADGSFRLAVPPDPARGERLFRVRVEGAGVVPLVSEDVFDAAESVDLADWSVARAARLAGRVVDRQGQPVPGAEVTVSGGSGVGARRSDTGVAVRTTRTEADGTFRFDSVAESGSTLLVWAKGHAPARLERVRAGALARSIVLGPGETLKGTVLRPDKRAPAAGALVRAGAKGAVSRWVEAGADGTFTVPDTPVGRVSVEADADESGVGEMRGVTLPLPADAALRLVLVAPAAIEGRVVDARTLKPVPRAKVQASSGEKARLARSGPDGRYRLKTLAPSDWRVTADEPRYVPLRRQGLTLTAGETRKLDLALTPGATITGRVVDENGLPIGAAKGSLESPGPTGLAGLLRTIRAGEGGPAFRTAPDGTFRASRLSPGDQQKLTVTHPEYERSVLGGLSLPAGGTKAGVTVTLRRGLALAGTVVDVEGQPVAAAEVSVRADRTFRAGRGGAQMNVVLAGGAGERPEVKSSADGRFEVPGLAPGEYIVTVSKQGYAAENVEGVKVGEGSQPLTVTLGPAATIVGTVRYRSGGPAEGVYVSALRGGRMGAGAGLRNLEPTGPDGFFALEGLREGESYDLQVISGMPSLAPAKKGVTAPAEGVDVVVAGTGRITGTAVDALSQRPLTEYTVSFEPDRAPGAGPVMRLAVRGAGGRRAPGGMAEKVPVRSDDGAFALEDVPAGTWSVVVEAKGYQPARVGGVVVEEGGSREGVEVKATPGGALKGRATDARTGRAVPNATVDVQPAGGGMGPMGSGMLAISESDLYTDADGRFEVDTLAAGKYKVSLRHPDYSEAAETVELKETGGNVELRLTAGSVLGGTVLLGARSPAAGVEVSLTTDGDGGGPMRFLSAGGQSTTADESGRFRFDHLAAGRYRVTATLRAESSAPQEVVLTEGESKTDVLLTIESGAVVRGTVTGLSTAEMAEVMVSANGEEGWYATARAGADGRFELAGAPAGGVTLRAQAGNMLSGMRSATKQVTVEKGQAEVEADVVFEGAYTLSGSVTRSGRPVTDAFVQANLRGGGGRSATARTDESGSYRMDGLTVGTYNVTASTFGSMSKPASVTLDGDQTLDLTVPTARVAGVVLESGTQRPIQDASVSAEPAGGSAASSGGPRVLRGSQTDSNGSFVLEDLDEATYTVTVRKPGFQFDKRDVPASERASDELRFELVRGEGVGITVRDGIYGIPLRSVMARVLDGAGNAVFLGSVALDGEGRGEVPSLKPGSYRMLVDASGYAALELPSVSAPNANLPIALTPGGTLEIRSGSRTLEKGTATATLTSSSGRPAVLSLFESGGTLTLSNPVRRIQNLAPGAYLLSCGGETRNVSVTEGGQAVVDLP